MHKIFIIGLPRTATTSVCKTMLDLGYKTAHTAYTHDCFKQAQVIADTPIFSHYPTFDKIYPNSQFINLTRELTDWIPSIRQLLSRMWVNLSRRDGGFNPIIKTAFMQTFPNLSEENIQSDVYLTQCYQNHQINIENFFNDRAADLLNIKVSEANSFQQLINFLSPADHHADRAIKASQLTRKNPFPRLNQGGKVIAWQQLKHPLKIESTRKGKIDKVLYPS